MTEVEEFDDLPPLTDEVPKGEEDAEPRHEAIDDRGNPVDEEGGDDAEA